MSKIALDEGYERDTRLIDGLQKQTQMVLDRFVTQVEHRVDAMWNAPGMPGFAYIVAHKMSEPDEPSTDCTYE